jgi:beta-phosphoglucomutase-like phosphatase (HAD superfamily)
MTVLIRKLADHPAGSPPRLRRLSSLPPPVALIFDLDGTLVDTVEVRIRAWLATFAELDIPAEREHVATLIGADGRRLAREVASLAGRQLDDGRAEAIDRRAGEIFSQLNQLPRPVPGATELLAALEQGDLPWAIATSSRPEQVSASVAALGTRRQPQIVDGSHVEHAKPAPDLLLFAADQLGVGARGCWYVGDSTWDMVAARGAAMVGIGIAAGAVSRAALAGAGAQAVTTFRGLLGELRRRGLVSGQAGRSPRAASARATARAR